MISQNNLKMSVFVPKLSLTGLRHSNLIQGVPQQSIHSKNRLSGGHSVSRNCNKHMFCSMLFRSYGRIKTISLLNVMFLNLSLLYRHFIYVIYASLLQTHTERIFKMNTLIIDTHFDPFHNRYTSPPHPLLSIFEPISGIHCSIYQLSLTL